MNAHEFIDGLSALEGSRESATEGNGVSAARLVNGVEYAHATGSDERTLRAAWTRRRGGGATPLVLVGRRPGRGRHAAPARPSRGRSRCGRVRAESLLDLVRRTTAMRRLEAVRYVDQEADRLDSTGVAGLTVRGLGTEHLYGTRLRDSPRWTRLGELASGLARAPWREALTRLGYTLEQLPRYGYLARLGGRPVAVIHPKESPTQFARLDDQGRLPEGALLAACHEHGVSYGLLTAGTRLRLLATGGVEAGAVTRYLDLDTCGPGAGVAAAARAAGPDVPRRGRHGRPARRGPRLRLSSCASASTWCCARTFCRCWDASSGAGRARRAATSPTTGCARTLEAAALTFVFRALFLLYAESAGHLPMRRHTYAERSLTRHLPTARPTSSARADPRSTSLWRDTGGLVEAMRNGQTRLGRARRTTATCSHRTASTAPRTLEAAADPRRRSSAPRWSRSPAIPDDPAIGVDFSGLEIGHLGHIYEGLLSLRLSRRRPRLPLRRRGSDRYVARRARTRPRSRPGELLWLTNEGGRKGGGVYYTRTELSPAPSLVAVFCRPSIATSRARCYSDPDAAAAAPVRVLRPRSGLRQRPFPRRGARRAGGQDRRPLGRDRPARSARRARGPAARELAPPSAPGSRTRLS